MTRLKFADGRALLAVRQTASWQPVADMCRRFGIGKAALFVRMKKCANRNVT